MGAPPHSALLLLAGCHLLCFGTAHDAHGPVVQTPMGAVRGSTMPSRSGDTIYAFRGMRYAKPPVGELRFKPPVPARDRWQGVKNATEDAVACHQAGNFIGGPTNEDCLFINVYTKRIPNRESRPRTPVLFFIHHGAWFSSSGQSNVVGPRYLMDEDIVLVTFNYRLGALGFLSTGDSVVPGNNGLKDQLLALKWVHENIESFGGDPNQVTIYGYSAGSASVQFLMASPRAAGLFHRAISSSGSALSGYAIARDPMKYVRRQAEIMNCPHDERASATQMVECLRGKDAEELSQTYFQHVEWMNDPGVIFAPVIESVGSSDEPLITEEPEILFQTGNYAQVPWLTGTTNNEMMEKAAAILQNETLFEDFAENFERVAPISLYYERGSASSLRKSRRLKDFYFPNGRITKDSFQHITDLYTDGVFLHGADRSVKLISSSSRSPVYYYQYTYRGRFGHMPLEPGMDKPRGAVHHDDLIHVFWGSDIFPFFDDTYPEAVTSKRLVRMWANFARTGNPTPETGSSHDGLVSVNWLPFTPSGLAYLDIGDELVMQRALRQERAAVWEDIYPLRRAPNNRRSSTNRKH
ncbi:juvenile hormone esterase-like [Ischnura elegans]|uniref:juvenile hormone esterase-like n=1 Tax=Ischnura elegans TaxID=197161 RepID=UPI001ED89C30|nr:juvenile hormone esterase-like [Ischnura elegans]